MPLTSSTSIIMQKHCQTAAFPVLCICRFITSHLTPLGFITHLRRFSSYLQDAQSSKSPQSAYQSGHRPAAESGRRPGQLGSPGGLGREREGAAAFLSAASGANVRLLGSSGVSASLEGSPLSSQNAAAAGRSDGGGRPDDGRPIRGSWPGGSIIVQPQSRALICLGSQAKVSSAAGNVNGGAASPLGRQRPQGGGSDPHYYSPAGRPVSQSPPPWIDGQAPAGSPGSSSGMPLHGGGGDRSGLYGGITAPARSPSPSPGMPLHGGGVGSGLYGSPAGRPSLQGTLSPGCRNGVGSRLRSSSLTCPSHGGTRNGGGNELASDLDATWDAGVPGGRQGHVGFFEDGGRGGGEASASTSSARFPSAAAAAVVPEHAESAGGTHLQLLPAVLMHPPRELCLAGRSFSGHSAGRSGQIPHHLAIEGYLERRDSSSTPDLKMTMGRDPGGSWSHGRVH